MTEKKGRYPCECNMTDLGSIYSLRSFTSSCVSINHSWLVKTEFSLENFGPSTKEKKGLKDYNVKTSSTFLQNTKIRFESLRKKPSCNLKVVEPLCQKAFVNKWDSPRNSIRPPSSTSRTVIFGSTEKTSIFSLYFTPWVSPYLPEKIK